MVSRYHVIVSQTLGVLILSILAHVNVAAYLSDEDKIACFVAHHPHVTSNLLLLHPEITISKCLTQWCYKREEITPFFGIVAVKFKHWIILIQYPQCQGLR